MQVKIMKSGNSTAIRLPAPLLKHMGLSVGSALNVAYTRNSITLVPVDLKPRYNLADLVAQCDANAPEPAGLKAWESLLLHKEEL